MLPALLACVVAAGCEGGAGDGAAGSTSALVELLCEFLRARLAGCAMLYVQDAAVELSVELLWAMELSVELWATFMHLLKVAFQRFLT